MGLFGGGSDIVEPELYIDPNLERIRQKQTNVGLGMLEGRMPEFLRPLTEIGGQTFEDYLSRIRSDLTTGVQEDITRRGVTRGGVGTTAVSQALGKALPSLRYNELLRAYGARESLFGKGMDLTGTAGQLSLAQQQERNKFNQLIAQMKTQEKQAKSAAKLQALQAAAMVVGTVVGSPLLGAALSGGIGAAGGGGVGAINGMGMSGYAP